MVSRKLIQKSFTIVLILMMQLVLVCFSLTSCSRIKESDFSKEEIHRYMISHIDSITSLAEKIWAEHGCFSRYTGVDESVHYVDAGKIKEGVLSTLLDENDRAALQGLLDHMPLDEMILIESNPDGYQYGQGRNGCPTIAFVFRWKNGNQYYEIIYLYIKPITEMMPKDETSICMAQASLVARWLPGENVEWMRKRFWYILDGRF